MTWVSLCSQWAKACYLFIYYFIIITLIALTGTLSTVLNSSGERGHLCLVPDLKGKTFFHD